MIDDIKHSAAENAYTALRQMILTGELGAGQSLRLAALQKQFGFGATPLREALNRLCADHHVILAHNQGFRVAELSLDELADLDRSQTLLEVEMLVTSIREGDEDWEGRIVASHYQLAKQPVPQAGSSPEEVGRWEMRHQAFHDALTSGCGSQWLKILLGQVEGQRLRYHRNILRDAHRRAEENTERATRINAILANAMGIERHSPLMEAALDRNEEAARSLMTDHIRLTSDAYQSIQSLYAKTAMQNTNS